MYPICLFPFPSPSLPASIREDAMLVTVTRSRPWPDLNVDEIDPRLNLDDDEIVTGSWRRGDRDRYQISMAMRSQWGSRLQPDLSLCFISLCRRWGSRSSASCKDGSYIPYFSVSVGLPFFFFFFFFFCPHRLLLLLVFLWWAARLVQKAGYLG